MAKKIRNPHLRWADFAPVKQLLALLVGLLLATYGYAQTGDFTVVVLPDTQYYAASYPSIFNSQMQWIVNNASALNIKLVLGEGDIVNGGGVGTQWGVADNAYKLLDAAHIPYFAAIGNHDYDANNPPSRTSATINFNKYFGPSRYKNLPTVYWQGSYPTGSNENFYGVVNINGQDYLILLLEFYPRDSALAWASQVLQNNPDKETILVTHSYEYFDNTRVSSCNSFDAQYYGMGADNDGDAMWTKLVRQYKNITMVLSGHEVRAAGQDAAGRRMDFGLNGNLVNQILANYQNMTNGGNGYLRIMKFHPSTDTIDVSTYSPSLNSSLTDSNNQFTIPWHNWNGTGNGSISGVVKDISSCSALAGATVTSTAGSAVASSSGAYTIGNLLPNTYPVTANSSGYTSVNQDVTVGPALTASAKLFLGTGSGQVNGTVTGSGGALNGATVHFVGSASTSATDVAITTDATGHYSSGNIPAGTYQITASAAGYSASNVTDTVTNGSTLTQNFTLTPTSTTAPTISSISPNSGPTAGGTAVTISGSNFAAGATVSIGGGAATVSSIAATSIAATTPPGTAGAANVVVTNPNGGGTATLTGGFTYSAGTGGGGTITGKVTKDDTTLVLSGATVSYSGGSTTTNTSGIYTLTNVPAGSVSVKMAKSGYQTLSKTVTVSSGATSTLNVALLPSCTISTTSLTVTICSPTSNSTVLTPVHIIAKATDTQPVSYTQIYVDGVKKYQINGSSINTHVSMSTGQRRLTVQATDSLKRIFRHTIYITVK